MLISKTAMVKWNRRNIKYYTNLGYKFKEIGKQSVKQEIREFLDDED